MSTLASLIPSLVKSGMLLPYRMPSGLPSLREAYLTKTASNDLVNPKSAVSILVGRGHLEAALSRWVSNGKIIGNKKRGLFLDRLKPPPPEVWEIRVTEPSVQARMFCRFAACDTLIITQMHTRTMLGKKGSVDWNAAMSKCVFEWNQLFNGVAPHCGGNVGEYVSEKCDDFPI